MTENIDTRTTPAVRWAAIVWGALLAAVAVAGLYLVSVPLMFTALFAFGVVSAMFGPVKYGILPDHLSPDDLPRANAWIEGATFFAIEGRVRLLDAHTGRALWSRRLR